MPVPLSIQLHEAIRTKRVTKKVLRKVGDLIDAAWYGGFMGFVKETRAMLRDLGTNPKSQRIVSTMAKDLDAADATAKRWQKASTDFYNNEGRIDVDRFISDLEKSVSDVKSIRSNLDKALKAAGPAPARMAKKKMRDVDFAFNRFTKNAGEAVKILSGKLGTGRARRRDF